ncbi:hypothetical protein [Nocardioides zeicaulis]|uniref:ABC transporter permease n=1 Tax=Nocardioides zeicaulis TaxID=1776857 RepID=A0ABV6E316_9ACTN
MSGVDPARRVVWVPLGGFLGIAAGAAIGALVGVQLAWTDPLLGGGVGVAFLGLVLGGFFGGVVGLFVGAELLLLVGVVEQGEVLRRRAYAWGVVLAPLTVLALPAALTAAWGTSPDLSWPTSTEEWALAWPVLAASLLGGPLARRVVS